MSTRIVPFDIKKSDLKLKNVRLLAVSGVEQSMDGKGRWQDNVVIERWFRTLKVEDVYINEYTSPRELRSGLAKFTELYNCVRPHF